MFLRKYDFYEAQLVVFLNICLQHGITQEHQKLNSLFQNVSMK